MARSNDAWRTDAAQDLQRFAIENVNAVATANVEKLLVGIRRQGQVASKRLAGPNHLLQKSAILSKHLYSPIFPVGYVHRAVFSHPNGMHDTELLRAGVREALRRDYLAMVVIHRLLPECAPHPLELSSVSIEHDHAMITVTVGYK